MSASLPTYHQLILSIPWFKVLYAKPFSADTDLKTLLVQTVYMRCLRGKLRGLVFGGGDTHMVLFIYKKNCSGKEGGTMKL